MHKFLLLACFSCVGRGWRRQPAATGTVPKLSPVQVFAMLLLEDNPAVAFNPGSSGAHFVLRRPMLDSRHPVMKAGVSQKPVINAYDLYAEEETAINTRDVEEVAENLEEELNDIEADEPMSLAEAEAKFEALIGGGPAALKEASTFFALRGIHVYKKSSAPAGTRTSMRALVRSKEGTRILSMIKPGRIIPTPWDIDPECMIPNHPAINQAIGVLSQEVRQFKQLTVYHEPTRKGTLRGVQINVENSTGKVQLVLSVNAVRLDKELQVEPFISRLWKRYGPSPTEVNASLSLHSIWVNFNPLVREFASYGDGDWELECADEDKIIGGQGVQTTTISGGSLTENWPAGAKEVITPDVKRRANLHTAQRIVKQVRELVPPDSRVVEWYAGTGVIGLSLAEDCEWVRCWDMNKPYKAYEDSWAFLSAEAQSRITYADGSIEEHIEDARGANIAIADPGRKGLDEKLLDVLTTEDEDTECAGLGRFIYIASSLATLRRDMDRLLESGRWKIRDGEVSAHVLTDIENDFEMVIVFDRLQPGDAPAWPMQPLEAARQLLELKKAHEPEVLPRWKNESTPRGRRLARNIKRAKAQKEEKRRLAGWTAEFKKMKKNKQAKMVRKYGW